MLNEPRPTAEIGAVRNPFSFRLAHLFLVTAMVAMVAAGLRSLLRIEHHQVASAR